MYHSLISMMAHQAEEEDSFTGFVNGSFDGNADGWTLGGSASYSAGKVTILYNNIPADDPNISQTVTGMIPGHEYEITFTLSDVTDNVYIWSDGGILAEGSGGYGAGTHTVSVFPDSSTETIIFESWVWMNATGWTIDDISMVYVGP